jgi:hypothetical protein
MLFPPAEDPTKNSRLSLIIHESVRTGIRPARDEEIEEDGADDSHGEDEAEQREQQREREACHAGDDVGPARLSVVLLEF